jgi:transketolase
MPEMRELANAIRFLSIDAIVRATEGHQGVPLGMAEIASVLFTKHFKCLPSNPTWFDRDRFVLSNGHGSMLLYSVNYLMGFEKISIDQIKSFRELGSHCAGHPEFDPEAGIEVTTGPLGQGIANALGMAVSEAYLRERYGANLVSHYTYAFVGDGCLQEGVGQEMIALAGHLRLGRLVLFWDDNAITDDGSTNLSISENVSDRFRVAGWHVQEIDGHDTDQVDRAISAAKLDCRPSLISCKTVIAKGISRLEGQRGGHSARLFTEDADKARADLGWSHTPFEVPTDVLNAWRQPVAQRGQAAYDLWSVAYAGMSPGQRDEFNRIRTGVLPASLEQALKSYVESVQSRSEPSGGILSSGEINALLNDCMPERLVLCADLEAPTAHKRGLKAFQGTDQSGQYVHCGVREHVMGSMANGMAAHGGVVPVAVTYLAFSDYERAAIRMAALMGLPVLYVFSHDSIGIGKNGPTHQPVEILASLRAMPNLLTFRPADAVEATECWQIALEQRRTPSSLVFSRHAMPIVRKETWTENRSRQGAYVLREASGSRDVTLLATGSEVQIALAAADLLQAKGLKVAVVSMPCWSLFEAQPADYRSEVLGTTGVRVGVEAAVQLGWDRYISGPDAFVGMTGFGASGPPEELYKHFGITAERVASVAVETLVAK